MNVTPEGPTKRGSKKTKVKDYRQTLVERINAWDGGEYCTPDQVGLGSRKKKTGRLTGGGF